MITCDTHNMTPERREEITAAAGDDLCEKNHMLVNGRLAIILSEEIH